MARRNPRVLAKRSPPRGAVCGHPADLSRGTSSVLVAGADAGARRDDREWSVVGLRRYARACGRRALALTSKEDPTAHADVEQRRQPLEATRFDHLPDLFQERHRP